jgi:hypothetical protein
VLRHVSIQYLPTPEESSINSYDFYFKSIATPNGDQLGGLRLLRQSEIDSLVLGERYLERQHIREQVHTMQSRDQPLRLLDLFVGGGGLSLGLAGTSRIRAKAALDISPSATATVR